MSAQPPTPERPGWHPDPWGDGQRYWDGGVWTGRTRVPPHSTELFGGRIAADEPPAVSEAGSEGPRDWIEPIEEDDDERPMRSGLMRGVLWAFAVLAIVALVTTAVAIWPAMIGR